MESDSAAARPNPIVKHAEGSVMPREPHSHARPTHDPLPEGKNLDAEPKHHFEVLPAGHDVERTPPKTAEELHVPPQEFEKLRHGRDHLPLRTDLQSGMDWRGSATQANKQMNSRHHHGGVLEEPKKK